MSLADTAIAAYNKRESEKINKLAEKIKGQRKVISTKFTHIFGVAPESTNPIDTEANRFRVTGNDIELLADLKLNGPNWSNEFSVTITWRVMLRCQHCGIHKPSFPCCTLADFGEVLYEFRRDHGDCARRSRPQEEL